MISLKSLSANILIIGLMGFYACQSKHQSSVSDKNYTDSSERRDLIVYLDSNRLMIKSDSVTSVETHEGPAVQIMNPAISPNGQQIAYTTIMDRNDRRTVSLMNLSTLKTTQLQIPSSNFYGPMWSPNSLHIAVNIFNKKSSTWKIGVIGSNNKGYKMLDSLSSVNYYSPAWKNNDQLIAHNMEKLYTLNLKGQAIDSVGFDKLIGKDYTLSSSNSFYFSRDGEKLFFNAGNQDTLPQLMGPSEALYELHIADKQIKRLSPFGMNVNRIFVTGDDRIFYEGSTVPFEVVQLFELEKGGAKLLAKEGSAISVASHASRP